MGGCGRGWLERRKKCEAYGKRRGREEDGKGLDHRFFVICHDFWVAFSPVCLRQTINKCLAGCRRTWRGFLAAILTFWHRRALAGKVMGSVCSWPIWERWLTLACWFVLISLSLVAFLTLWRFRVEWEEQEVIIFFADFKRWLSGWIDYRVRVEISGLLTCWGQTLSIGTPGNWLDGCLAP